ncbi:hypothetical protein [Ekhidna sp.]|uniref:hypothetical protein n=1 Tax=Ekhidna sp. TaxID=2608089 RepID=UPI003297016D
MSKEIYSLDAGINDQHLTRLLTDKVLIENTIEILDRVVDPDSITRDSQPDIDYSIYHEGVEYQSYQIKLLVDSFSQLHGDPDGITRYSTDLLTPCLKTFFSREPGFCYSEQSLKAIRIAYVEYLKKLLNRVGRRIKVIERLKNALIKSSLTEYSLLPRSVRNRAVRHRSKKSSDDEVVIEKSIISKLFLTITNFNNENERHNTKRAA